MSIGLSVVLDEVLGGFKGPRPLDEGSKASLDGLLSVRELLLKMFLIGSIDEAGSCLCSSTDMYDSGEEQDIGDALLLLVPLLLLR